MGAKFRQGDRKGYGLLIGRSNGTHYLGRSSSEMPKTSNISTIPGTIRPLEWHKTKISLRGPRIRIEFDDQVIFDCNDDFNQKGAVGLTCSNSAGRFRNIKVTAPDGTILWEGVPDLRRER